MKNIQAFAQKIDIIGLRSGRASLFALCLIIGIILVACGGGSAPSSSSTDALAAGHEGTTAPAESPDSAASEEDAPDAEKSENSEPGTEEFGLTEEELVKSVEAVEAKIATCMSDAGFEYVPVDFATVREAMESVQNPPGTTEAEFRAQYGYAISIERPAADDPAIIGMGEENLKIFESLSEADQTAYNHTLFGENDDETFAVALDSEDFADTGGCTRAAIEQVFDPEQLTDSYVNPKDVRIEQDARVLAAITEWSSCMREAGFDYANPEEIESDIEDRLDALLDGADPESLSAEGQAALTELQGEERAISVADYDCEVKFIVPAERQVETELYGSPQN
jgi:hypothetical protein